MTHSEFKMSTRLLAASIFCMLGFTFAVLVGGLRAVHHTRPQADYPDVPSISAYEGDRPLTMIYQSNSTGAVGGSGYLTLLWRDQAGHAHSTSLPAQQYDVVLDPLIPSSFVRFRWERYSADPTDVVLFAEIHVGPDDGLADTFFHIE